MKFIITEEQFRIIKEQLGYPFGYPEVMKVSFEEFKKEYPILTSLLENLSLWFVPYIGPYLVTAKGSYEGIEDIQKGNTFIGIVELITSPLGLGKFLRFAKLSGLGQSEFVKMAETIYKSGLPVLRNEGIEQFFRWAHSNFGPDKFKVFTQNLEDTTTLQAFLDNINYEERKKTKSKTKRENNEPKPQPNTHHSDYSYDKT